MPTRPIVTLHHLPHHYSSTGHHWPKCVDESHVTHFHLDSTSTTNRKLLFPETTPNYPRGFQPIRTFTLTESSSISLHPHHPFHLSHHHYPATTTTLIQPWTRPADRALPPRLLISAFCYRHKETVPDSYKISLFPLNIKLLRALSHFLRSHSQHTIYYNPISKHISYLFKYMCYGLYN